MDYQSALRFVRAIANGIATLALTLIAIVVLLFIAVLVSLHFVGRGITESYLPSDFSTYSHYESEVLDSVGAGFFEVGEGSAREFVDRVQALPYDSTVGYPTDGQWFQTPIRQGVFTGSNGVASHLSADKAMRAKAMRWLSEPGNIFKNYDQGDASLIIVNPSEGEVAVFWMRV